MTPLTDSHAHLSLMAERGQNLSAFFRSWADSGGGTIVDVGVRPGDLAERRRLVGEAIANAFPDPAEPRPLVGFTAGAWPGTAVLSHPESSLRDLRIEIESVGSSSPVIALGEVGLDYHWMEAPAGEQSHFFEGACALAKENGLPLIVHSRDAAADTLRIIAESGIGERTLIHCFSYGAETAKAFLDLGAYLSFSGSVTYKSAENLRGAAAMVSADRILAETDAPYLTPGKDRGRRGSTPLDVSTTIAFLAQLRGVEPETLIADIKLNATRLFKLLPG